MILTPGPVTVSAEVIAASNIHLPHRSSQFRQIMKNLTGALREVSGCHNVSVTTGSGTLAVESIIYSLISPRENVLCVTYGEFAERAIASIRRRGSEVSEIKMMSDETTDPDLVVEKARISGCSTVFLIHNETGNGTALNNLRQIAGKAKEEGLTVLVDSVSGFAAIPLDIENWGIDAVATCGHKGIGSIPGASIVFLTDDARKHFVDKDRGPLYLDIENSLRFMEKDETPYTPAIGVFASLNTAMNELLEEGIDARISRTKNLSDIVIEKLQSRNYTITGNRDTRSRSVLNIITKTSAATVVEKLAERGYHVSGGMGEFRGRSIRIGLMGAITSDNILEFLDHFLSIDA